MSARAPLSQRLRRLVVNAASEATLTCTFSPGGRVRGAGVVSHFHCVHCNQSLMWHDVAAAIPDVELAEAIRAAGLPAPEKESSDVTDRRDVEAAAG